MAQDLKLKDNIYRESVFNAYTGLDLTDSVTNMPSTALRIADNCDITISGSVTTRGGFSEALTSVWIGYLIHNGIEYRVNDSTTQIIISGIQTVGSSGALGIATTSVSNIRTGLSNSRPSLVQFSNLLFYFNGVEDFIYNGSTTYQIGIDPPTIAPTDGGSIAGSLLSGAEYGWVYTYYNSVTGAESSPSDLLQITLPVPPPDTIGRTINVTPGDPATADTINLYRTTANGPILFLDNSAPIGSTSISSTQPDAGLGRELVIDNTRLNVWGHPKYAVSSNNRIFVAGFEHPQQNRVRYSSVEQNGPMPQSYQARGFIDCQSNFGLGDYVVGLGTALQTVMVLKQSSIGRLDVSGSFTSEVGTDNVIYQYNEISRGITGVSHWAITNVLNNMVWLAKDNIYMTDGTNVMPIATAISALIKTLNFSYPEKLSAINDVYNRKVMFFVCSHDSSDPDLVLVGSYQNYPNFYWTTYNQGPDKARWPGIQARCAFLVTQSDDSKDVFFGNYNYNGQLYHLDDSTTDNGFAIRYHIRDYPTSYGLPEEKKLFFKDFLFVEGDGSLYNITASSVYDLKFGNQDLAKISILNEDALWDVSLWDDADWQEPGPVRVEYSTHYKAFYKQIDILQEDLSVQLLFHGEVTGAGTGVVVGSILSQAVSGAAATVSRIVNLNLTDAYGVESVTGTFDTTHIVTATNPDSTTNEFIPTTGVVGTSGHGQPITVYGWTKNGRPQEFK